MRQPIFRYRLWLLALFGAATWASQTGPVFPTHHFPTDKSFHLSFQGRFVRHSQNFIDPSSTSALLQDSAVRLLQMSITGEYQPTRQLSFGAIVHVDSLQLSNAAGAATSSTGLGDQRIFAEYRFYDKPGFSIGGALMVKFPGYSNPTFQDVTARGEASVALLGDAQIDLTSLVTSEFWFTRTLRLRVDGGYTFRTESFAGEFPYSVSLGFATPKVDFDVRLRGNFSAGNDGFETGSNAVNLQQLFANSAYAYSRNPMVMIINPALELWLSNEWGLQLDFAYSLIGKSSPQFFAVGAGFSYRWAESKVRRRRTFQEVGIETDQEAGQFQGEQGPSERRSREEDEIDDRPLKADEYLE